MKRPRMLFMAIVTVVLLVAGFSVVMAGTVLYGVSGTVKSGNTGVSGVSLYLQCLDSTGAWVTKAELTTSTTGTYDFGRKWAQGTYKIVLYKMDTAFSPSDQTIKLGPNATGVNFAIAQ